MHEIGHAVGFYHEHQRGDAKDFYVLTPLITDSSSNDDKANYSIMTHENAHGPYDCDSRMHYPVDVELMDKHTLRMDWRQMAITDRNLGYKAYTYTDVDIGGKEIKLSEGDKASARKLSRCAKNTDYLIKAAENLIARNELEEAKKFLNPVQNSCRENFVSEGKALSVLLLQKKQIVARNQNSTELSVLEEKIETTVEEKIKPLEATLWKVVEIQDKMELILYKSLIDKRDNLNLLKQYGSKDSQERANLRLAPRNTGNGSSYKII